ncbi:MAG: SAM hydrolase/SAM-dependent halogenase family protein [Gammaproteobacteria bacterium]
MIVFFTDFGNEGPYSGQVEAKLYQENKDFRIVRLVDNAPAGDPRLSSYLLAATCTEFPPGCVFLCVVDPGVGGDRLPVVLQADDKWFVGPDNGLLNTVAVQADTVRWWIIHWRPEHLSPSFHGRDLFAPIAAQLANGNYPDENECYPGPDLDSWPADIATIVYIDHYGNALSGWRYTEELDDKLLVWDGHHSIARANTFCDVAPGQAFWYCNSSGLVEIAVNRGRADEKLGLAPGKGFRFQERRGAKMR